MGQPIDKITIEGFKSIRSLKDFPLRNLNILIGANGAGKSNFVEFFRMLRAMADEGLQLFVAERGRADDFFFMGSKRTPRISALIGFCQHLYEFHLAPNVLSEMIIDEHVYRAGGAAAGGAEWHSPKGKKESLLRLFHGVMSANDTWSTEAPWQTLDLSIHEIISSRVVYHFHDTSMLAPMRRSGSVRDNEYLRPDAANLGAFLLMLRDRHERIYERIRDTVRLAAPFFDDFKFRPRPSNGDEMLQLEWTQRGSDYPFLVTQLSDGTLRFIALTTALLQPNPPATMLFDEPELGLHPYALNLLAALLQSVAVQTQLIVSTQSAALLDNFEAEDIIVVEREDGASTFTRQSSGELAEWLKNYSLGELWQKNVIGGRPADG